MEIPVIDFSKLAGEERPETMALLHHAYEKWGFFMVSNCDQFVIKFSVWYIMWSDSITATIPNGRSQV